MLLAFFMGSFYDACIILGVFGMARRNAVFIPVEMLNTPGLDYRVLQQGTR